jgi:large subunit ribosomal protein L21
MYAVIRAGGKQYRVSKGDVIEVERLTAAEDEVSFEPVMLVLDDGAVRSLPSELAGASVNARILSDARGPKVRVLRFRNKTGYRRHTGHRQSYTRVEIADIEVGGKRVRRASKAEPEEEDNGS